MKLPEKFFIRIQVSTYPEKVQARLRTYFSDLKNKNLLPRVIKDLLPPGLELSFAKNLYNGGRYSNKNIYSSTLLPRYNYRDELVELIFEFTQL